MGIEIFKKHLREKRAIKISAGNNNYDTDSVAKICNAAQIAKASAVEICANKEVYDVARKNTKLPLFVSSVHPFEILKAVELGVDGIQIGPYYDVYKTGSKYLLDEIYDIVLETFGLINDYDVYKSVTIPASLSFDDQCKFIKKLEILGVDLILSEGYKKSQSNPNVMVESAEFSIKNLSELRNNTVLPIMATSAINKGSLKLAFDNGADAVNIDSLVSKLDTEIALKTAIMEFVGSISYRNSLNKEIIKTAWEMSLLK